MKRNKKSSSTGKFHFHSIASSQKKTTIDDIPNINWQRQTATKSSVLLPTLSQNRYHNHEQDTFGPFNSIDNDNQLINCWKSETTQRQKLSLLHTQIGKLEKQIMESQMNGKNKCKGYQQQLKRYEQVSNEIAMTQNIISLQKQKQRILKNRIEMLQQDYTSTIMNFQQKLAQKQYCDEVLQQYGRQYENQGILVLDMLKKQNEVVEAKNKIANIQCEINTKQNDLNQWKNLVDFDLQEKVIKNKITQLRIDLMKAEQQANTYAQTHKILKIRQILCLHIKQYICSNRMMITSQELNEDGMQIFICKNDICQEFQQALFNYRGKDKSKYQIKVIEKYFCTLQKIENNINNPKFKLNRKINKQYVDEIANLRKMILSCEQKIKNNQKEIESINEKVQMVFASESVAIIEHLRESQGRYELGQIKSTLKKLKQEQKNRIDKIKSIYKTFKNSSVEKNAVNHVDFMNKLTSLKQEIVKQKNCIKNQQNNQKKLLDEKEKIQNDISLVVGKWNQIALKKQQLKRLYKKLNHLNSQIRHSQKVVLSQRQFFSTTKHQNRFLHPRKAEIITNGLKQTLKMRINGRFEKKKQSSKENIHKMSNILFPKQQKNAFNIDQFSKTKKSSLSKITNTKLKKIYQNSKKQSRDSLTAVLMAKFVN